MGRFESPFQVLGLFLAASVVSVGVIFFVNAEAHNRLSRHELPDSFTEETSDGDGDAVGPLSLPLSSSKFVSSSELTQSSYATNSDSNYTSSSRHSSPFLDLDAAGRLATNVTLLNFLEDGLEKLLSLIKQAKNTYKSYYLYGEGKAVAVSAGGFVDENTSSSSSSSRVNGEQDEKGSNSSSPSGTELHHPRRRKKREAHPVIVAEGADLADAENPKIKNRSAISGSGARLRRAVISQNKRKKIGENEPYYWQMLEDNNSDNHHHNHNHHYHHRDERSRAEERDRDRSSSSTRQELASSSHSGSRTHYSNSQYPHYYPHHNQQQQQQNANQPESHYFRSSSSSSGSLAAAPGQAPAVASAFTGGQDTATAVHSVHNPTSDFHKIRHAMNKLGGGGLDISVLERMILDTKSSGRSHSPASSRDQPQHFNRGGGADRNPLPGNNHLMNAREDESLSQPASSLLTTAITKTTQQGRQDEGGLFVNQLRSHQQQLAQSLLPPTVTWLDGGAGGGGDSTAVRYLPLPSSSLATGSKDGDDDDDDDNDNDDDSDNDTDNPDVDGERNNSEDDNERDDDGGSNENSVSSTKRRKPGEGHKKLKKMMKRKKFEKAQRRNNELSYSPLPSSSSSTGYDEDEDYDQPRYRKGNNNKDNDNSDSDNSSGNVSYGDNTIMSGEEMDMDESRRGISDEEEEEEEGILLPRNNSPPPPESQPSTPPHRSHDDGAKGHNGKDCYHTDDVLIVVAITCCLNFAFVLVIWALVRWFSISSNPKEKDFQNLGDCDDTMDPTIVFHGVTEDPCWTASMAAAAQAGADGRGTPKEGGTSDHHRSGMMTTRSGHISGMGLGTGGMLGANLHSSNVGGGGGMVGMLGSIHSVNKVDLFPTMGKMAMGSGSRGASSMGGTPVMTMTAERRLPYQSNLHIGTGGIIGLGSGGVMISGAGANVYSFKPEHVPTHHGSSGTMHRSYSQSMEDLRYIQ